MWSKKNEHDKAIADYSEAIRLNPKNANAYLSRGLAWRLKDEHDKSLADFTSAIRADPKDAAAHLYRGRLRYENGEYGLALVDYKEAIRLDPRDARAYEDQALIFATSNDADFRDGPRAVESAARACELTDWKDWRTISTLAAAYAEVGDFDQAIKYAGQALSMTPADDQPRIRRRLDDYRVGIPTRFE